VVPIGLCEDYPETSRTPEAVAKDMEFLRQAGIRVLRVSIPWDAVEPEKDRYDWTFWDQLVHLANQAGVRLLPYVAYTPKWNARPEIAAHWTSPPRDLGEFSQLMELLAARYRGRIHSWEIWNEPDNRDYWGGSVEEYGRLLAAGARAVHKADPDARVVSGGLASRMPFLQKLIEQGSAAQVDVINLHGYFETWSPSPLEALPAYLSSAAQAARGRGPRSLWAAEVGYSNFRQGARISDWYRARFAHEHTHAFQTVVLVRTLALLLSQPEVDLVAWYELKDPPASDDVIGDLNNRHLGVATNDYQPKPALQALRFANQLFGRGFANLEVRVESPRSDVVARAFRLTDGRLVVIAWLATDDSSSFAGDGTQIDPRRARVELVLPAPAGPARSLGVAGEDRGPLPVWTNANRTVISGVDLRADDVQIVELAARPAVR
jgi:hypothetical protein